MNIVFLGSGAFGIPTLEMLAREHSLTAIVTQPDRRAGRGSKLTPTPIAQWAHEHIPDVPVLKPENVNDESVRSKIRAYPSDAWVVIAFGQYLGSKLIADRSSINLHASKLPRWRGAAPINAAIVAQDTETGNSVITIAREMDAGDILAQSTRTIEPDQTASELHNALSTDGPALIASVLEQIRTNTLTPVSQNPDLVTLAPKMSKSDGWVDFTTTANACARRINGLSPWPSVIVTHQGEPLKLLRATPEDHESQHTDPGTILDPAQGLVACANGTLRLLTVQPPNKKPMPWRDYANGRQIQQGEQLFGSTRP
jgi:methionyl-tRNA formyltransferase